MKRSRGDLGKITSYPTIRIRIPTRVQTPRIPPEMHDGQPLAFEVAPVHPVTSSSSTSSTTSSLFILVVAFVAAAGGLDARDLQLDVDQSDGFAHNNRSA